MRLHVHPASKNARRARAVVEQLGLPVEIVVCDLMAGAQHDPAFLAKNPNGRVPVLEDGDFVLWESMAIMQYLASQAPNSLWPDAARTRADITRWMAWDLAHFGASADVFLFENVLRGLFGIGGPRAEVLAEAGPRLRGQLDILNHHLTGRDFLVGAGLTLADFALAASYETAVAAGAPVAGFPAVARWYAQIAATPAWQRAR